MTPIGGLGPKTHYFFLLLLLLLASSGSNHTFADENKSATSALISVCEWHMTHRFAKESVRAAYKQIGITAKFIELPCRRSLIEANAGAFDGEIARIAGADKIYSNLIMMNSPAITIQGVVIATSVNRPIAKWSDLSGLNIGIIRGELYAEKGTAGLGPTVVNNYNQLMSMIAKGNLQAGVVIMRDFKVHNSAPQFVDLDIHVIGKPVFSAPLYHLVHQKNSALVPKLNIAFKKMWESGETQSIHSKTMLKLTKQTAAAQ